MDTIFLRDLSVDCIIGVNPDERVERQLLILNLELGLDLSAACRTDKLEETINYKEIQDRVVAEAESSHCLLVERLAQRLADVCLAIPRVQTVTVTVDKPRALRLARSAAVRITRARQL
jgi:FolB domain-containing protein